MSPYFLLILVNLNIINFPQLRNLPPASSAPLSAPESARGSVRPAAGSPLSSSGFTPRLSPAGLPGAPCVTDPCQTRRLRAFVPTDRREERRENPGIMADLKMSLNGFDSMNAGFSFSLSFFILEESVAAEAARGPRGTLLMESRVFIE